MGQPMSSHPAPQPSSTTPAQGALARLLAQMPNEVAQSFDERQLAAIQAALVASTRKRHPVDVRWSIPLLMRRFYVVLLMGEEERSKARRHSAPGTGHE